MDFVVARLPGSLWRGRYCTCSAIYRYIQECQAVSLKAKARGEGHGKGQANGAGCTDRGHGADRWRTEPRRRGEAGRSVGGRHSGEGEAGPGRRTGGGVDGPWCRARSNGAGDRPAFSAIGGERQGNQEVARIGRNLPGRDRRTRQAPNAALCWGKIVFIRFFLAGPRIDQ